jgi:hypothetical protein
MKKAILIDVKDKSVIQILMGDDLDSIYNAIGNNCDTFCCPVSFENEDSMYADDEILLRRNDIVGGFIMLNWARPILNNVIILGTDDEGSSIDHKTDIQYIKDNIRFIDEDTCKDYADSVMGSGNIYSVINLSN